MRYVLIHGLALRTSFLSSGFWKSWTLNVAVFSQLPQVRVRNVASTIPIINVSVFCYFSLFVGHNYPTIELLLSTFECSKNVVDHLIAEFLLVLKIFLDDECESVIQFTCVIRH